MQQIIVKSYHLPLPEDICNEMVDSKVVFLSIWLMIIY